MPTAMTKMERFQAAVAGKEVDRVPVSVWLHFASEHLPGEEVARVHLRYQAEYDWDYVKVMNDYRFPLPGMESVKTETDLRRFKPLGMEDSSFAQQLTCLRRLREELGPDVPIVETVFNPLQTVLRGAGDSALEAVLSYPEAAHVMLEACTQTLIAYVGACREAGVTGIFFSVNGASRRGAKGGMTDEAFQTFVASYDKRVLEAAAGTVRIGHIHGLELAFDRVLDYPLEAYNWSHHHTPPSLAQGRNLTRAALIGGIDEMNVFRQTPAEVTAGIQAAVQEAGNQGFLVGPGCTVPPDTPRRILHAVRSAVHDLGGANGY